MSPNGLRCLTGCRDWETLSGKSSFHLVWVNFQLGMAMAYMALFPRGQKVYLSNIYFRRLTSLTKFLGVCGPLEVLSLLDTYPTTEAESGSDTSDGSGTLDSFILAELEELVVSSTYIGHKDFLLPLLGHSPPAKLKSLSFENFRVVNQDPCSIPAMEKLLRLASSSLMHLVMESYWVHAL
ncbi:hypothetical protein B0H17DRAFT_1139898 [Mycena rosella]|uniref:Uncharacterized protein n=1 Tax=Mycena rosella TaxID=1033263 RepID=A0AAD7D3D3_MYCRO|nr:hypothetical protein B0H17DRAFT_1139898 [Mycena rosella]